MTSSLHGPPCHALPKWMGCTAAPLVCLEFGPRCAGLKFLGLRVRESPRAGVSPVYNHDSSDGGFSAGSISSRFSITSQHGWRERLLVTGVRIGRSETTRGGSGNSVETKVVFPIGGALVMAPEHAVSDGRAIPHGTAPRTGTSGCCSKGCLCPELVGVGTLFALLITYP